MYRHFFKRFLDIIVSAIAIVLLLIPVAILALIICIKLGSPIIFAQKRPGKNEKIFTLYKFRTMTNEKDAEGRLLSDEKRLTRFGKLLRKTSLDEIPELWNILRGDMSIVGPRPLLVEYLCLYNEKQKHRHDVRPGLTGYAQVNGRNSITWEEKFDYDVQYAEHISFTLDFKIILKTVKSVLKREGISSQTSATMEAFTGTKIYK